MKYSVLLKIYYYININSNIYYYIESLFHARTNRERSNKNKIPT